MMIDSIHVNKINLGSRKGSQNRAAVPNFNNFDIANNFQPKGVIYILIL